MNDDRAFQVMKAEYLCKYHNQTVIQYRDEWMRLVSAYPSKDFREVRYLLEAPIKQSVRSEYSEKECKVILRDFSSIKIDECVELAFIFFNSTLQNIHTHMKAGSVYISDETRSDFTILLRDSSIFLIPQDSDSKPLENEEGKFYLANQFLSSKGFAVPFKGKDANDVCDLFDIKIESDI